MSLGALPRDPATAAADSWDLVIVGGGIHGVCLLSEAVRRGLKVLLLERMDFGGATTFNSLRIVHGGLRYLQSLDLPRHFRSVRERRWFLRSFPDLVEPLPCLMPLYGDGLRRPMVFRCALALNDLLSADRNRGVVPRNRLPGGRVVNSDETRRIFPDAVADGLRGGAVWYDACAPDSQRLIIEMLRRCSDHAGLALNYMEARDLDVSGSDLTAVIATDQETGGSHAFRTRAVINAAGPWCRHVARAFDRDKPQLFYPNLAWNALFDRPAPSDHALAVTPSGSRPHTYFLYPWKGRLLAGTAYVPWHGDLDHPAPSDEQMGRFIADLNDAVPGLHLDQQSVVRVFSGLLPAREEGSADLSDRDTVIDHGAAGGPRGLWSVSGVKLTTARHLATTTLGKVFVGRRPEEPSATVVPGVPATYWRLDARHCLKAWPEDIDRLRQLVQAESVVHLDDLVVRRTTLWEQPSAALALAPRLCELFGWNAARTAQEMERLRIDLQLP